MMHRSVICHKVLPIFCIIFDRLKLLCLQGHIAGLVTMEVACDSHVISNLVVFEYRVRETSHSAHSSKHTDWFSVSGKTKTVWLGA